MKDMKSSGPRTVLGGGGCNYYIVVYIYFYLIFTTFMYNTSYINITFNLRLVLLFQIFTIMHDMLVGRSDRFAAPTDNTGRQGSRFNGRSLLSRNIPVRL